MDNQPEFYLGRKFDPSSRKTTEQSLLYDPDDLTTHAVVVGMTGSGKTGLCIDLLEEAALRGIPALMIDPKGDITNLLLHFPDLSPHDFQPWVNPDQARREGKTLEQAAMDAARLWKEELGRWGIAPERLLALKESAQFAVYTPGSDAGIPVNILSSFKAPSIPWEENREALREKISGTVTALLSLVGLQDIDPVRSREHILLANIFEQAWKQGGDLDLGELIMQTQTPPFQKLGVFDVNIFFPEKDRFELAMLLNNILAAPSFQTWIEGPPLDIPTLLFAEHGRPKHSVFYITHLSDAERMFFITLLFTAVETWMRSQPGSASLRAIVYFDEIFGYVPPIANPASKPIILRMLKQARAFGIGLVLVTQNPVDLDYKGLSNAGTWFIGKLQTEKDKMRLLDGLESALTGGLERREYDRLISALGKRVFLLHNVHQGPAVGEGKASLFQTRWAMNFLAGPLTREQIPLLNRMVGAVETPEEIISQSEPSPAEATPLPSPEKPSQPERIPLQTTPRSSFETSSSTRPALPSGVREYILPNNLSFTQAFQAAGQPYPPEAFSQGLLYRPVILAQASLRFLNRKYNLDYVLRRSALVTDPDRRGVVRWDEYVYSPLDLGALDQAPDPQARFAAPEAPLTETRLISDLEKDFLDWAYRTGEVTVRANETLKLYAGPEVSQAEFRKMCAEAARMERDAEVEKVTGTFDKRIETLAIKSAREKRELAQDETEHAQRKMEEAGTHAENLLSIFSRRSFARRISTSLTKRRLTEQAKADVEESVDVIKELEAQTKALQEEKAIALERVNDRWGDTANQVSEIAVTAMRKDVLLDAFGVAWLPYHVVMIGDEVLELPGFNVD